MCQCSKAVVFKYGRVALLRPCVGMQTMLHRPAPLTVAGVYKTLRQIAEQKGQGSAARRQQAILGMLRSCRYMPPLKHHNVEAHIDCPQTFLSLEFQGRDDVPDLK